MFYCTTEAASLIKGVIFCWDIRANYATKSTVTVAECVIRLCLGCVDELLAAFLEFPGGGGGGGGDGEAGYLGCDRQYPYKIFCIKMIEIVLFINLF